MKFSAEKSKFTKVLFRVALRARFMGQFEKSIFWPKTLERTVLLLKSQTSSERTRYHAMLHWMHDITDNLNPEDSGELEKFKKVQQEVRTQKLKFENRTQELVKQLDFVEKELDFFVNQEICVGLGVVEGRFEPLGDGKTEIRFEDVHQLCLEKSKNHDGLVGSI